MWAHLSCTIWRIPILKFQNPKRERKERPSAWVVIISDSAQRALGWWGFQPLNSCWGYPRAKIIRKPERQILQVSLLGHKADSRWGWRTNGKHSTHITSWAENQVKSILCGHRGRAVKQQSPDLQMSRASPQKGIQSSLAPSALDQGYLLQLLWPRPLWSALRIGLCLLSVSFFFFLILFAILPLPWIQCDRVLRS